MAESLQQRFEEWKAQTLARAAAKVPECAERTVTVSGRPIDGLYLPDDTGDEAACEAYLAELGFPGEYPFTRGVQPTMYRGRLWTMRQFAGFGTARDTNERFKFLLDHGQTGLSVAFDFPTLMGRDADEELARGEVGWALAGAAGVVGFFVANLLAPFIFNTAQKLARQVILEGSGHPVRAPLLPQQ